MSDAKSGKKKLDDLFKDVKGKTEKSAAQTRSLMTNLLFIGAILAALGLGYWLFYVKGVANKTAAIPGTNVVDILAPGPLPDVVLGDANAKVTIVEYASLTCPHCGAFHTGTLPDLKKKYIDTGKVRLILRGLPLNEVDLAAQMLGRCLPSDKYYAYMGAVFEGQKAWLTGDIEQGLKSMARQAGFTEDSYKACLDNTKIREGLIESSKLAGEKYGVESTPTFFINGIKLITERTDVAAFEKVIDPLLK